tara:strand:+ start:1389 stop:1619 length:231 start_codon:yes stop_codon:yes gene_type:complete
MNSPLNYFPYGIIDSTIIDADFDKTLVPLELLINELVRFDIPCLFPTLPTINFPEEDVLKRFFTLLLVLSLGIFTP